LGEKSNYALLGQYEVVKNFASNASKTQALLPLEAFTSSE